MMTGQADRAKPTREAKRHGRRLRALREAKGWSQGELARRTGVTRASISYLEKGERSGHVATFRAIARALGISTGELLGP